MDGETPADPATRRSRGQIVVLDAHRRRHARGHPAASPTTAPSCRSRADDLVTAQITTRDIDRGDVPALPAQGDHRGAGVVPQDAAGQARRARRPLDVALRPSALPDGVARRDLRDRRDPPGARHRPGHRRGRRPGLAAVARRRRRADGAAARRGDARHRAVGLRACAPTCPTRWSSRSASRAPPPTPTAPSTSSAPAAPAVIAHRQPAQQRPHRQVRRRALHVRRSRRGDERGVDQGVLRPDRGRLPARRAPSPTPSAAPTTRRRDELLAALRDLPDAMAAGARPRGRDRRGRPALAPPSRRYWAIVGNGPNRIAAAGVRIKLSELCYKSIACDATEDKKHIDLSSEPLILVCAAGLDRLDRRRRRQGGRDLPGPQGRPDRHRHRRRGARSPPRSRRIARAADAPDARRSCCRAMAGHLFGYEAALAIDAQARPLREAAGRDRGGGRRPAARAGDDAARRSSRRRSSRSSARFFDGLRAGAYDGHLEASTAVRLASLFRYALGDRAARGLPGRARQGRHAERRGRGPHRRADPGHRGADPARRRHQAPGQDRHRRHLALGRDAARRCRSCGRCWPPAPPATGSATARCARSPPSTPRSRRSPASPATASRATSTARRRDRRRRRPRRHRRRAAQSRTERDPRLRGTKHRVAVEREVLVARGRSDGRTVMIVPEVKDNQPPGSRCCTSASHDRLPAADAARVLQGYRNRYDA